MRRLLVDDLAARPDDAVDDVRLHQLPAEAERARDHCHLERRDEHPLLSEGHPPGVDVRIDAWVVQLPVAIEAAREPLVGRCLERWSLVEAELLRRVEDPLGAELEADVAEHRVHRVDEARHEVDRPEDLGAALVGEVVNLLPVHGAVPRVVEGRAGPELLRFERRGHGDHLEDRARDEQARARPVEEWCGGGAVRGDVRDLAVVLLDEVRVEARRRGHHQHLPRARVERDDSAAVRAELFLRDLLGVEVERRHDVVPLDRPAVELVERLVEDRREVGVGGGQVVVERSLEPRARPSDGRVADDVRREGAVRIAAEVERLAVDDALAVPRQAPPWVEREDEAAVDRELGDAPNRVVLPRGETGGGPGLPVRRHDDERADEPEGDVREPHDLAVHRGAFALFDTSRSSARSTKFATMLVPP